MYRVSLNYRNQDGIGIKTGQDRINANLSLTQKAMNDKAEFSVNVANTSMKVFFKVSKVEDTIEGTIKKITKGFFMPPVKNNKKLN